MIEASMALQGQGTQEAPDTIVVHAMAEFLDMALDDQYAHDFLGQHGLSAHVLITPTGTIIRCLQDEDMGAHAKGFNNRSLGIEFLVPGLHTYATFVGAIETQGWLSPEAYEAGMFVIRQWMDEWQIRVAKVLKHSTLSPGRKVDPGAGFPWPKLMEDLINEERP